MTEFQVGDRVSVEGVVLDKGYPLAGEPGSVTIAVAYQTLQVPHAALTLVERPKRKLRVGSVWEVKSGLVARYVVSYYAANGEEVFISLFSGDEHTRSDLTFDSGPHLWREVPVEELEREAQA